MVNDSLDSLINNLSCDIYNATCKHFVKCKNYKECEKCVNDSLEWWKICTDSEKKLIVVKAVTKYMKTVNVVWNM